MERIESRCLCGHTRTPICLSRASLDRSRPGFFFVLVMRSQSTWPPPTITLKPIQKPQEFASVSTVAAMIIARLKLIYDLSGAFLGSCGSICGDAYRHCASIGLLLSSIRVSLPVHALGKFGTYLMVDFEVTFEIFTKGWVGNDQSSKIVQWTTASSH
jgi:hypothetical protein